MTKSPLLFFFGCVLGVFGASTTSVHVLNIERAIVGLEANMASNSVSETHYDFVAILEDEIHSFAGMLSGTGQLVRALTTGTNLLACIVSEPDEQTYMSHFKEMESAILGMRFREGSSA